VDLERRAAFYVTWLRAVAARGYARRMSRLVIPGLVLGAVTGCWTAPAAPTSPQELTVTPATVPAPRPEYRAIVRFAAQPSAQPGVWLELADGQRWVIADRESELWRAFEGQAVVVTGHCAPSRATHFEVERMRFARPPDRSTPVVEIGPEVVMRGEFVKYHWPAGSKLAGTTRDTFVAGGTSYWIAGMSAMMRVEDHTPATLRARRVAPDPAYMAGPGGEQIWIVAVSDDDDAPAPAPVPCPSK
jgi:hypothetical protein